jgi:hypothetical protein
MPDAPLRLFIMLPGRSTSELLRAPSDETACVGDLKTAIIAEFKRLEGLKADVLQLFKLDGSSRTLLNPVQTLSEAGITSGTKLEVAIEGQSAYPGF